MAFNLKVPWRIIVAVLVILQLGKAQTQVGNFCTFQYTGTPGVCKLSTHCPLAKKQAEVGIKPTICGFQERTPIVCCEETGENSFVAPEIVNGADVFAFPDDAGAPSSSADIINEKCQEYSKSLYHQLQVISLTAHAEPTSINVTKCDHAGVPLIVGGKPAEDGEFPHMAAIGFRNADGVINWNCGGTLISDRFVLSAAHCATSRDGPPVKIRLGVTNIHKNFDTRQDYDIAGIIKHPNYMHSAKYDDIVLFRMDTPATLNTYVRPACLWHERDVKSTTAIATGWGRIEFGGSLSDKLLKVTLKLFSKQRCENTYRTGISGLPRGIVDSMLCAGDLQGGKDTCNGDSGGPLVITKNNNQCVFYVVGITSFGKHCAAPNTPAIYTRVSSYVDWIVDTIW